MRSTRNYTGLHILPFGMICKWNEQLLADGGHGRLIHEPTLGRDPEGVNWRFGGE